MIRTSSYMDKQLTPKKLRVHYMSSSIFTYPWRRLLFIYLVLKTTKVLPENKNITQKPSYKPSKPQKSIMAILKDAQRIPKS